MSQTPTWIVLVTAALAVVGTLAATIIGHHLSTRREATQFLRRQQEDAQRWEQSRAERQEQWHRDDQTRWHRERLDAYTDLLASFAKWQNTIQTYRLPTREEIEIMHDALTPILHSKATIDLIGSSVVGKMTHAVVLEAVLCVDDLSAGLPSEETRLRGGREHWTAYRQKYPELVNLIRQDLGLEPDSDAFALLNGIPWPQIVPDPEAAEGQVQAKIVYSTDSGCGRCGALRRSARW